MPKKIDKNALILSLNWYPPASEVRRKVANLTWRENPHTPIYGVKNFFSLSVATGKIEWAKILGGFIYRNKQKFISRKVHKFGCLGYFCRPLSTIFDKIVSF